MAQSSASVRAHFARCARRTCALATLALVSSGCALINVDVEYPTNVGKPAPIGAGREVVLRLPFADQRQIRDRCGMQKNGFNMDTADVPCPGEPALWFGELLTSELKARGFAVNTDLASLSADPLVIQAAVQKLFLEPVVGPFFRTIEADFQVELVASSRSGLYAQRTFFVKGSKSVFISDDSDFQDSLDKAARAMVNEIAVAIVQLSDRFPTVGRVQPRRLAVFSPSRSRQ